MKIDIEVLKQQFADPFLPRGFLTVVEQEDQTVVLTIGNRDVHIDRDGKTVLGSGTALLTGSKWDITKT